MPDDFLNRIPVKVVIESISILREKLGSDRFIASPVASDGKIYVVSDQGNVYTLKAGAEFEILAENKLGDISMVVPALTDDVIYFRTQHSLIAVSDIF